MNPTQASARSSSLSTVGNAFARGDVPAAIASIPDALNALEATVDVNGSLLTSLRDRLEAAGVLAPQSPAAPDGSVSGPSLCALASHLRGVAHRVETNSDVARDILDRLQL